jgi:hypothetical protein
MITPVIISLNVFFPISEFDHFPMKTSISPMGISQNFPARFADSSPPGADVARRWQCLGFAEQSQRVTGVLETRWVSPGLGCCVVAATPGWCLIWGYWQNLADISWDILGIIIIATHLKSLPRFWRCPIGSFQLFATYPGTWDDCLGLGKIGQPGGKISYCWYVLYIYNYIYIHIPFHPHFNVGLVKFSSPFLRFRKIAYFLTSSMFFTSRWNARGLCGSLVHLCFPHLVEPLPFEAGPMVATELGFVTGSFTNHQPWLRAIRHTWHTPFHKAHWRWFIALGLPHSSKSRTVNFPWNFPSDLEDVLSQKILDSP